MQTVMDGVLRLNQNGGLATSQLCGHGKLPSFSKSHFLHLDIGK